MSDRILAVTDTQFPKAVLESELPVLVDFWAPWCGPCRLVGPILEDLAQEYDGRLRIAKVNTEQDPVQAMEYGVQGIPTMILFKHGVEADRVVGALPKVVLQLWVEETLGRGFAKLREDDERRSA